MFKKCQTRGKSVNFLLNLLQKIVTIVLFCVSTQFSHIHSISHQNSNKSLSETTSLEIRFSYELAYHLDVYILSCHNLSVINHDINIETIKIILN